MVWVFSPERMAGRNFFLKRSMENAARLLIHWGSRGREAEIVAAMNSPSG
jgi:hypothetical protein